MYTYELHFFFFFQAEDGIRDLTVTGVQTCALPISVHAGVAFEARKLPMKFTWVDCQPNCRGWVSAAGIVTAGSPREFDEFARGRQLEIGRASCRERV